MILHVPCNNAVNDGTNAYGDSSRGGGYQNDKDSGEYQNFIRDCVKVRKLCVILFIVHRFLHVRSISRPCGVELRQRGLVKLYSGHPGSQQGRRVRALSRGSWRGRHLEGVVDLGEGAVQDRGDVHDLGEGFAAMP